MARNRQRASERKGRRRAEGDNKVPDENLHREEVPGSLDHASGDVDEVEASIVAGAGGQPDPLPDDGQQFADEEESNGRPDGAVTRDERPAAVAAPAEGRGGPRFLNFLRACWAELQRVQWPDRRQVGQATAVVLGFVVVAGAFLGLVDVVAQELVDLII